MGNWLIHVGSITNAMRGKSLLEAQHIRAYMQRETKPSDGDGCGYSLLVSGDKEKSEAERILRGRGVRVVRIERTL